MKIKLSLAAGLILAGLTSPNIALASEAPRTTFVHLFEWRWNDIATECETFLGPKGFSAVQVSPPQKSIDNPAWWSRYQPVSYSFEGRSGSRHEFQSMVQRCKAAGVDIYVDAVINHMAAWDRNFPEVPFGSNDFNNCTDDINYGDRWSIQNCDLVGLNDLKTGSDYVRQKIADYMNDAIGMGVAGFRIDAAKHMPAGDIAAIKSKLNGNPYIFQEVIGAGGEPVQPGEYTYIGDVTEFNFARTIGPKFKHGGIKDLQGIGSWGGWLSSDQAVTFVTNHDEERHNPGQVLSHQDFGNLYMLGNVFTLAYPYGYPKIMSGYYFNNDFDAGPPSTGVHSGNACGFDGGSWVCEHKWRGVANMVAFRNHTASDWRVTNWWDDGYNQIAFGRGGLGFVAINRDDNKSIDQGFQTGMPAGEYCDVIAGNFDSSSGTCDGPTISVDSSGYAHFTVAKHDAAAIHVGAKVCPGCTGSTPGPNPTPDSPVSATAICIDNRAGLSNPYLYYWNATPAGSVTNATWPGVQMTKNGDFYCHDLGIAVESINVIFSDNGANKTDDLVASSDHCYSNGQWDSLQGCGFSITGDGGDNGGPDPVVASKVCYDNAENHSQPTLYYWNVVADQSVANATWPGVALREDNGVYCHDFGLGVQSLNAIFSNAGANQSDDLSTSAPELCYSSGQWQSLDNCQSAAGGGDEAWYFRGTSNAWGLSKLSYDASSGLYTTQQSFNGEESPARFKIDSGSWTEAYPSSDYQVGDYASYKIDFNSTTKQITVTKQ
ncbi:starch-binding protein [Vibrio sp. WXL210]|uniref:starch-binding protein n=1 Tax=Vibrio sp. WXL210 TaxID=3450709 RepID=UPI003EC6D42C